VHYLAGEVGLDVLQYRASDLMSKWVGDTEKQIARAFETARAEKKFLLFDEADSLLFERGGATRNWEVSQVNEMLTWMEQHPLPFACTNNLVERLDQASLRRFTFKVEFRAMTPSQSACAFRHFFRADAPISAFHALQLAPGDFAVVKRKAKVLARMKDVDFLLDCLTRESDAKSPADRVIGFKAA